MLRTPTTNLLGNELHPYHTQQHTHLHNSTYPYKPLALNGRHKRMDGDMMHMLLEDTGCSSPLGFSVLGALVDGEWETVGGGASGEFYMLWEGERRGSCRFLRKVWSLSHTGWWGIHAYAAPPLRYLPTCGISCGDLKKPLGFVCVWV